MHILFCPNKYLYLNLTNIYRLNLIWVCSSPEKLYPTWANLPTLKKIERGGKGHVPPPKKIA